MDTEPSRIRNGHALAQFLERFFRRGRFVFGADPGGDIAVEIKPPEQRRMAVDMAPGKAENLVETGRVTVKRCPGNS